jgi:hypothetical protein
MWTSSCLSNTHVWIFGDSNGVRLFDVVSNLINAATVVPGYWPFQFIKADNKYNTTVTFSPVEYPKFMGHWWRERLLYGGVAKQIDNITSKGSLILVIHYYLHISYSHLNVVFMRLKAAKEAIQRLMDRNPDVIVGIRGPHVTSIEYNFNHAIGGDNLGIYLNEMTRYVFKDLKHKVVFLDGWGMTIALENEFIHPVDAVPFEMMRTLLAFKCA